MPDMKALNQAVIAEFRANDGMLSGPMAGAPILILTTTGRRSGKQHTTPVGFIDAGGRLAIAAANGGADDNPDWFHNLAQNSAVTIEVPGATIPSLAVVAQGDERASLLAQLAESLPGMSDHIAGTGRQIPVVVLTEAE